MRWTLLFLLHLTVALSLRYRGVSESGAQSGSNVPGVPGIDYAFPDNRSIQYFLDRGANLIRVPILWERIQPRLNTSLDPAYTRSLEATVQYVSSNGGYALIDIHNYMYYNGSVISSKSVPTSSFYHLWYNLALRFKSYPSIIFALMNEPQSTTTENVLSAMQTGINAVRDAGASQMIAVAGNGFTGARTWTGGYYGNANSVVLGNLTDPLNNFIFEMHQYLDYDYSGTHIGCVDRLDIEDLIGNATNWLRTRNFKGFLGEWGFGDSSNCYSAASGLMNYLYANSDVWIGHSYWAAGPIWNNYFMSVEPKIFPNGTTVTVAPQWSLISRYMTSSPPPSTTFIPAPTTPLSFGGGGSILKYRGVAETGLQANPQNIPGTFNVDYMVPSLKSIQYFMNGGINVIKIPLSWERLQPVLNGTFDVSYAKRMDAVVGQVTQGGAYALIDIHNKLIYNNSLVGSTAVPISTFANLWSQMAMRYSNNSLVMFGLAHEPSGGTTENVLKSMQAAINAIRNTGSNHTIWAPGNGYTGAATWTSSWYGTPNSVVMGNLTDRLNSTLFDMHFFLDSDSSGTKPNCVGSPNLTIALSGATQWLRNRKFRGIIGSWGFADSDECYPAARNFLEYLQQNSDVWAGASYWTAGLLSNYFLSIEPSFAGGVPTPAPQWDILLKNYAYLSTIQSDSSSSSRTFSTSDGAVAGSTSSRPDDTVLVPTSGAVILSQSLVIMGYLLTMMLLMQ